jgi:hypothetical protein
MSTNIDFRLSQQGAAEVEAALARVNSKIVESQKLMFINGQYYQKDIAGGLRKVSDETVKTLSATDRLTQVQSRYNAVGMNTARLFGDMGYGAQSFNMLIMSVGNNISPFIESLRQSKQEMGSWGQVIKTSFAGFGGWLVAINLAISAITAFSIWTAKSKKETDEHTDSVKRAALTYADLWREINKTNEAELQRQSTIARARLNSAESAIGGKTALDAAGKFGLSIELTQARNAYNAIQLELFRIQALRIEADRLYRQEHPTQQIDKIKKNVEILSRGLNENNLPNLSPYITMPNTASGMVSVPNKPGLSISEQEIKKSYTLQFTAAQNTANAIGNQFKKMWADVFGTAQSFWGDLLGGILNDLTDIATKALATDLINTLIPGAGLVGGWFTNKNMQSKPTIINVQIGNQTVARVVAKGNKQAEQYRYSGAY